MPRNPTSRTPLLRLPGMRRADAPGLGRTNPEVRRNVSRLRRLLTPKISRRRQPTETLMMMITEECHREEMQAFATRRPADEGPTHYSSRRLARTVAFILLTRVPRPSSLGPLALPQRTRKGWGTLIGTAPLKPKNGLNGPPALIGTAPLKPKNGLNGPPATNDTAGSSIRRTGWPLMPEERAASQR